MAAEQALGRVVLALGLRGHPALPERARGADHAEAAAPAPRRRALIAQLVALDADREGQLLLLDRVVADVLHEAADRVHAVLAVPPAPAGLVDLHVDPVLARAL